MEYAYQPLAVHGIRLLHLETGNSDEVRCSLSRHSLAAAPSYEALSYQWADHRTVEVKVIEQGQEQRLLVTVSLFTALRNLQLAAANSRTRTIWADGICINQNDDCEKSMQVKLMADIYSKAERVVTYIGDSDGYTAAAIAMARKLIQWAQPQLPISTLEEKERRYLDMCSYLGIDDIAWDPTEYHPDPIIRSIQDMFNSSWTRRLWIFQESVLNQNIIMMCGRHKMPWTMLDELGGLITQEKIPRILHFSGLKNPDQDAGTGWAIRRMASLRRGFKKMALVDIIQATQHLLCSDPRDKIYGLYGVFRAVSDAQGRP
ncbi:hypothetical protein VTI74DRAFT_4146 [Chaetomium olivicolor]